MRNLAILSAEAPAQAASADAFFRSVRHIVAQASFLHERLDRTRFVAQGTPGRAAEERLERWASIVARGDRAGLLKRLQWDGLGVDDVAPVLGDVALAAGSELPHWAQTLQEIMRAASPAPVNAPDELLLGSERSVPFSHLLMPAVAVGRELAQRQFAAQQRAALLSEPAYGSLERQLLAQLNRVCADTLYEEFLAFAPGASGAHAEAPLSDAGSNTRPTDARYRAFVQHHLRNGLRALFEKYPVLGRLVSSVVTLWAGATVEFLSRLSTDLAQIARVFVGPAEPPHAPLRLAALDAGLSDLHHHGRSVMLLTFTNGLQLIYKPKDMGQETAFNGFLDWCRQRSDGLDLRPLRVLNRGTYGWVEYVTCESCADASAAERFYARAGMLLAIVHALRGTDCHSENLIASGEHLVLIDAETLFHHEARLMEGITGAEAGGDAATERYWQSVLRTGMLPRWNFSNDNKSFYDISGLGSGSPQAQRITIWRWHNVNTDQMDVRSEHVPPAQDKNVPHVGDKPLSPDLYRQHITAGFRRAYEFLTRNRDLLLSPEGPLAPFRAAWSRFIFRPTRIYAIILQRALQPACLRSGADFSIALEYLSYAFLTNSSRPHAWAILHAEHRALERLDIPFFAGRGGDDALYVEGEELISGYFQGASHADVLARLGRFDEHDLACQLALIEGCFLAIRAQGVHRSVGREPFAQMPAPSADELIERAVNLGEQIATRAIHEAHDGLSWIGLRHVFEAERVQLQVLNDGLYDGRGGIAVFFAALYRVTRNSRFRDLALRTLSSFRQGLRAHDAASASRYARFTTIGGAAGLGSIIYSLVRVADFAEEPELLGDARTVAGWVVPELIQADTRLDVMGGAAGTILGLASLYEALPDMDVLRAAIQCGDHLLARRTDTEFGPRAWRTLGERPLTGFSHGAAGISYALLRLQVLTRRNEYRVAALEGMQYERSVFSPAAANWPDFREQDAGDPSFLTRWCHGAPGIALGRLASLDIARTGQIEEDGRIALSTTAQYPMDAVDHLCCGNFGRIDALLTGAQRLHSEEWRRAALNNAANVLARADRTGEFRLFPNLSEAVFDPGFFRGTAGIGYVMLRLACDELPSVLIWD